MAYLAKHRSKADSTKHDPTTKGIIVKNALAYFAKYGIEGTTLSQIREASGQCQHQHELSIFHQNILSTV